MRQLLFENQKQQLILYTILKKMQILTLKKGRFMPKVARMTHLKQYFH